jgi:hypothetical protein
MRRKIKITRGGIDFSKIKPGPIRHQQLSPELQALAKESWDEVGRFVPYCRSFEDWELGFMRDSDPEGQIRWWLMVAKAMRRFRFFSPSEAQARNALKCFLGISMAADKPLDIAPALWSQCASIWQQVGGAIQTPVVIHGPKPKTKDEYDQLLRDAEQAISEFSHDSKEAE